jgi:hypothetical protein
MIAGIVYDYRYQGHTIEERWTSIVMTVILLSSIRVGPLLIHVLTLFDRCPWYMRQNKSVYAEESGHFKVGNPACQISVRDERR